MDGCSLLGFDLETVWETLGELNPQTCRFIKTLNSDVRPGELLDVYDALVDGRQVYVKIKITETHGKEPKILVVLSFKRNEFYD